MRRKQSKQQNETNERHGRKRNEMKRNKNETKKALEEYEKVLKISPNFFKDNDYLIVHIPEELKAIFNLYSL